MFRDNGFTIIELMLTIALAGVVLAIGVPSFQSVIQNNRTSTETNNLVSALNLARSEAIGRGLCTALLPLTAGDWSDGWTLGTDINCDADFSDGGEIAIRAYEGMRSGTAFTVQPADVVYQPTGGVAAGRTFTLTPANCSTTNQRRQITIALSGIVDLELTGCP